MRSVRRSPMRRNVCSALLLLAGVIVVMPAGTRPIRAAGETVQVWITAADQSRLLQQQPSVSFALDSGTNATTITVNEQQTFQTMDGFGASLTDSSASLLYSLSATQRDQVMISLFDRTNGIGMSFLRQPIGASDFVDGPHYTYDDLPSGETDFTMSRFSIAHDEVQILPLLRRALQLNPELKIMASPWSPPAWMKTSNSLVGGRLKNDPAIYQAFALYLVKFVQAYEAAGVPIYAISPQNEPQNRTPDAYPGTDMPVADQNAVINALGPALANAGLSRVKIISYDHNWSLHPDDLTDAQAIGADPQPNYPFDALNASAAPWIAGTGFHMYAGTAARQTELRNAFPTKDIWFTEGSGWHGVGDSFATYFRDTLTWHARNIFIASTRNWAKGVINWNLTLNSQGGPVNGGCGNNPAGMCTGVVAIDGTTVTRNAEYYSIGHYSKFVRQGAARIASNNAGSIENVAFKNPDGSKVLVAFNNSGSSATFKVVWGNSSFTYTLPATALATFTWSGTQAGVSQIEAENASVMSGVQVEACSDTGGGQDVGWTDTGDYLGFTGLDLGTGVTGVEMRLASGATFAGGVQVRLGSQTGTLIGTVPTGSTGGWQTWVTTSAPIARTSGVQNVYLVFQGGAGIVNVNWIRFTGGGASPTATATSQATATATATAAPTATTGASATAAATVATSTATPTASSTPTPTPTVGGGTIANGTYRIIARHSGKALDVANHGTGDGSNVQQWTYTGGNNQRWTVTHLGGGQYQILGVESNKALDAAGSGTGNGTNVQIWTSFAANNNQKWTIIATSGGYYRISPVHAPALAIDVAGVSTADGANAQLWTYGGGTHQQFAFQAP